MVILNKGKKGFVAVELVVVIILVGLIALAGWYIYKNQHSKKIPDSSSSLNSSSSGINSIPLTYSVKKSTTASNNTASVEPALEAVPEPCPEESSYLLIKEWHFKIKLRDACRLQYEMEGVPNDAEAANTDMITSFIGFQFDDSINLSNKCRSPFTGSLVQATEAEGEKIGNFYYGLWGGYDECGDKNSDILRVRVVEDLTKFSNTDPGSYILE